MSLPCISCWAVGGAPADAIPVTAAWTALHYAACILDTVQDGDTALAAEFKTPAISINLATGLLFAAFRFLDCVQTYSGAARQVTRLFSQAGFRSSLGQHLDLSLDDTGRSAVEVLDMYWRAVIFKSGNVFRAAAAGGAAVGTDSDSLITTLGEFGNALGVILQIRDDCRDVLTGSPTINCEISLPLLLHFLIAQNNLAEGQTLSAFSARFPLSKENLIKVLSDADIINIITDTLLEWRQRALNSLAPLRRSKATIILESIVEHVLTTSLSSS